jgi:hypothetical protein
MPRRGAVVEVADQPAVDQVAADQGAESLPAAIGPKEDRADTKAHNHSVVGAENLAADRINSAVKAQHSDVAKDKTEIRRPMVEKTLLPVLPPAIVANRKPPVPKVQPREPQLRNVTRQITPVPKEPPQPIAMPPTIPEPKVPLQVPPSPTATNPHSPVPRARPPDRPPSEIPSTILGSTETIGMVIIPAHGPLLAGPPVRSGGQRVGAPSLVCAAMRPPPSRITMATT